MGHNKFIKFFLFKIHLTDLKYLKFFQPNI